MGAAAKPPWRRMRSGVEEWDLPLIISPGPLVCDGSNNFGTIVPACDLAPKSRTGLTVRTPVTEVQGEVWPVAIGATRGATGVPAGCATGAAIARAPAPAGTAEDEAEGCQRGDIAVIAAAYLAAADIGAGLGARTVPKCRGGTSDAEACAAGNAPKGLPTVLPT
mmetsp:Transcript_30250/g.100221  ORF Transcript_30250/g.100221 Transcript_30250/m.100221 type:complete len:165 (-) Transcript_30250:2440-2934(-)